MPCEELEKFRLEHLREIVQFAYDHAPYYKRSFDAAGVHPSDIQSLSDLQKCPFISKITQRETQGVGLFPGELCAVSEVGVVFISTPSGSTGVPNMSPFTKKGFDAFRETESRWFWQIGEKSKKAGIDPKTDLSIRKIIVAGELGGFIPATRKAIKDLWGAELCDFYGLSDIF